MNKRLNLIDVSTCWVYCRGKMLNAEFEITVTCGNMSVKFLQTKIRVLVTAFMEMRKKNLMRKRQVKETEPSELRADFVFLPQDGQEGQKLEKAG